MYFPDRGCVHTLLTLYVYATGLSTSEHIRRRVVAATVRRHCRVYALRMYKAGQT